MEEKLDIEGEKGWWRSCYPRVAVIHFCPGAVEDWITPTSPLAAPSTNPVLFDNTLDPLSKSDPSPDSDIDPSFDPPVDSLPDPK